MGVKADDPGKRLEETFIGPELMLHIRWLWKLFMENSPLYKHIFKINKESKHFGFLLLPFLFYVGREFTTMLPWQLGLGQTKLLTHSPTNPSVALLFLAFLFSYLPDPQMDVTHLSRAKLSRRNLIRAPHAIHTCSVEFARGHPRSIKRNR